MSVLYIILCTFKYFCSGRAFLIVIGVREEVVVEDLFGIVVVFFEKIVLVIYATLVANLVMFLGIYGGNLFGNIFIGR